MRSSFRIDSEMLRGIMKAGRENIYRSEKRNRLEDGYRDTDGCREGG